MKLLIIFRHAKSSWDDAGQNDKDRPLSARGRKNSPTMAARIAEQRATPSLILASTATRALDTASCLAAALGEDATLQLQPELYLATAGSILAILAQQADTHEQIAVVGHNPGLTDLANILLPELRLANLPTAGAIAIRMPIENWCDIGTEVGVLEYFDYPKKRLES
jgi:phosphohistidine phosphatase